MKIYFSIAFFLVSTFYCWSQADKFSGELIYKVSFKLVEDENNSASEILKQSSHIMNNFRFNLIFNNSKSRYYFDETMVSDLENNLSYRSARKIAGDVEIFTDVNNSQSITKKDFLGETFLTKDKILSKWTITKESKLIENMRCFKATLIQEKSFLYPNGKNVIAWFTNEIPYSHGPKGYGGLPGLILQLEENNLTYVLTELKLTRSEVDIYEPKGGIDIDRKTYNAYVEKKIKEFKFE